jgi:hypothetical protein
LTQAGVATVQGVSHLLIGVLADWIGTAHAVGSVGVIGLLISVPAAMARRSSLTTVPDAPATAPAG